VAVILIIWLILLIRYLPKLSSISPRSASLPFAAMLLVGLIFVCRIYIYRYRHLLREFSILALLCLVIVSNQFALVRLVGDGQQDAEFKLLADWYVENAKPGEKMGVYMASVVKIFAPKYAQDIVPLPAANSPEEFVKVCRELGLTYIVWATREGLRDDHTGYRRIGLHKNIAYLQKPQDSEDYQFITQVAAKRGYVNIFCLLKDQRTEDR
jgi:hypothetical protein